MLKKIGLVLSVAGLVIVLFQAGVGAQSTVNLQSDLFDLRSQVSQLRSEVSQLRQSSYSSRSGSPAPLRTRTAEPTSEPIVDRLAILAIEAKDRLNALEARVARLEKPRK
jgi:outer membrane murein-binding lipoprotein Lpp